MSKKKLGIGIAAVAAAGVGAAALTAKNHNKTRVQKGKTAAEHAEYRNTERGKYEKNSKGQNTVSLLEVDFVCNKGSQRYYIQSAYSIPDAEKMSQEQASFDRINDSFKKIIVVQDNVLPWHNEKGYLIINILDFLLNPNSLEL